MDLDEKRMKEYQETVAWLFRDIAKDLGLAILYYMVFISIGSLLY